MTRLACPHCGETRLWSDEPTTVMYPVAITREGDDLDVEYTGESYDVMDEGTEYVGHIWCRTCGQQLAESDLVPASAPCSQCAEYVDADDVHAGHGMCGSCLHDAIRSGWEPGT